MTPADRLSLSLRLRDASATIGELFEGLVAGAEPKAMLADADKLGDLAGEILSALVGHARQPGELQFVGANVLVEDRPAEHDKPSQHIMAARHEARATELEAARDAAGITALLDDTAPVTSSDRDQRGAA